MEHGTAFPTIRTMHVMIYAWCWQQIATHIHHMSVDLSRLWAIAWKEFRVRCRFEEGFLKALFCKGSHIILESFSSCSTENWDTTLPNGVDSYILACALKEPPRRGIQVSGIHYFILHSCIHSSMHACIYPSIYHFFWQYLAYILATLVWVCVRVWVNGKTIVSNTAIQARTYFITQERTRFRLWSQPRDRPARGVWLFSHVWQTCAF